MVVDLAVGDVLRLPRLRGVAGNVEHVREAEESWW